jgi:hypothetical protein
MWITAISLTLICIAVFLYWLLVPSREFTTYQRTLQLNRMVSKKPYQVPAYSKKGRRRRRSPAVDRVTAREVEEMAGHDKGHN